MLTSAWKYLNLSKSIANRRIFSINKHFGNQHKKQVKMIPIKTLSQLLKQQQKNQHLDFSKQQYEPEQLFLLTLKCIKKNLYEQKQQLKEQELLFNSLQKHRNVPQFSVLLLTILVPMNGMWAELNSFYKKNALSYLSNNDLSTLTKFQIYCIVNNLNRIVIQNESQWSDEKWLLKDYDDQQKVLKMLVPAIASKKQQFDIDFFQGLVDISNTLNVQNHQLAAYLQQILFDSASRLNLKQIIKILNYLSNLGNFPFQYFYKNKQSWLNVLQKQKKYSKKKSYQSIKIFSVIVQQNPMNCEKTIRRLQDILLEAIPSFDNEEIANILYQCCRAKFGLYFELVLQILYKMAQAVDNMETKELCLIVRGLSRFKYFHSYKKYCEGSLRTIKGKLDESRKYEHSVIDFLLKEQTDSNQVKEMLSEFSI